MMKRLFLLGVVATTLSMTACNKDEDIMAMDNTGTVRLNVTDAPTDADNIEGVYITFNRVEFKQNGEWQEFEGLTEPKTINLLALTEGKTELLGDFQIGAGEYSDVRFYLDAAENGGDAANAGTYIAFADGTTEPLYVPSGTQSGYKANGEFTVPINGTVNLTADFDLRKSVVKAGNSDKWILKPVIRLVVAEQAGSISGTIEGIEEETTYLVYAYANGTFAEDEASIPAAGEAQFPKAVSSTRLNADGTFTLAFLAPGTYDLVVAAYSNGEFIGVINGIDDVEVTAQQTTQASLTF